MCLPQTWQRGRSRPTGLGTSTEQTSAASAHLCVGAQFQQTNPWHPPQIPPHTP
jgi:hypothetical protein